MLVIKKARTTSPFKFLRLPQALYL